MNSYFRHRLPVSRISLTVFAILFVASQTSFVAQAKAGVLVTDFPYSELPSVLADLTNIARAENGLAPVTHTTVLDAAAEAAAQDMASKGYFAHEAPDGTLPWQWLDQAGYAYRYAGQNLAIDFIEVRDMQAAWLASPTHRENIMKPKFTEIGFGMANGQYQGRETTFVVAFFGTPSQTVVPKIIAPARTAPREGPGTPASPEPIVLGTEIMQEGPAASSSIPEPDVPPIEESIDFMPEADRPQDPVPQQWNYFEPLSAVVLLILAILCASFSHSRQDAQKRCSTT